MKSGRAKIGIFQKMRIKNLRGVSQVRFKKNSTPSPWKHRKTTSSAIFCATGAWGLTWRPCFESWALRKFVLNSLLTVWIFKESLSFFDENLKFELGHILKRGSSRAPSDLHAQIVRQKRTAFRDRVLTLRILSSIFDCQKNKNFQVFNINRENRDEYRLRDVRGTRIFSDQGTKCTATSSLW